MNLKTAEETRLQAWAPSLTRWSNMREWVRFWPKADIESSC